MTKNQTQIALPFLTESRPEFKDYVKQHWNVTFARQKKVSVFAKRIMALVLAQIRDDDLRLRPCYQIHIASIATEAGVEPDAAYKEVRKAMDQLTNIKWTFEDLKKQRYVPRHLLDTTKTIEENGFECGYNHGWITVVLNPALRPYFLQLAHYSTYELKHYMSFKSWYSMRMFELLAAFKDTGVWTVTIDEFRELMDCTEKYPLVKDLIGRTLTEPLEELENTRYAFTYKPLYDEQQKGKGRKGIVGLQFTIKNVEIKTIPPDWYAFSDDHKRVLEGLKGFRVSEVNITRYAKAIGLEKAKKLLKDWQEKERSNKRIDNKEKYCNAVWVRVGKKCMEAPPA